jgi:hypothetical protein
VADRIIDPANIDPASGPDWTAFEALLLDARRVQGFREARALRNEYWRWRLRRGLEPTLATWDRFNHWRRLLRERDDVPALPPLGGVRGI